MLPREILPREMLPREMLPREILLREMLLRVITAMPVLKHMIERLENPFERFEPRVRG